MLKVPVTLAQPGRFAKPITAVRDALQADHGLPIYLA